MGISREEIDQIAKEIADRVGTHLEESSPEETKTWLERLGDCYRLAFRFIIREDEGYLIHGRVFGGSPPRWIEHAWVELPTGLVYEPVAHTFYKKDTFYQRYNAEELKRFSPTEAAKLAIKFRHFGPWYD